MKFRQLYRTFSVIISSLLLLVSIIPASAQDTTATPDPAAAKGPIIVASKDFNESLLLGQMFILLLQEAGFTVEDQTGLGGSPAVRSAIENGEIDLYPEYTGTAVSLYHNLPGSALPADSDRLYLLAKSLDAEKGLVWLERATFNNTYTLMVRQETIDQGITTIEALAEFMNANNAPLKICVESEFYARLQDGLKGVEQRYGFAFKEENVIFMDVNETYEALRKGECEVAEGFATDGRINAWGFSNLEDTLSFFPIYNPAPIIRQPVLEQYPELEQLLGQLGPHLDTTTMSQLNARLDLGPDGAFASGDEESPVAVAYSFLRSKRLLKPPAITVASKDYTEQLVLGKIVVALLQDAGYEVLDKTGLGGSTVVRQAMENGEVDVYVELTGSALAVHNGLPVEALPADADKSYLLAKSLDVRKGIVWLDRGPFNDTYALMVGDELWNQGVQSIETLAQYMNDNDAPLTICVENDFFGRANDGLPAVQARYNFNFKPENVLLMELDEAYEALRAGECDVAEGYSTDGRGAAWGFHNLADPLAVFPFYNAAPVLRQAVLDSNPELADILNRFLPHLDDATMSQLNARVDIGADGETGTGDEETPEDVAYSFLRSKRLIKLPPITVASKDYTEQLVLGKMVVLLLQEAGYEVVDKTGLGGSKVVRQAMENGEVDVYVELTGSALAVHNGLPGEALPTDPDRSFALAKSLDARKGIIWLERGPFNDTSALMVRDDLWSQGMRTIADLAQYMNANDAPLTLCVENDFFGREHDGLPAVEALYGFTFKPENVLLMELDEAYEALRAGECDVAEGYSTDGRGAAWGFFNLEDTLAVFPFYNPSPVIRQEVMTANPELLDILGGFVQLLDDAAMSQLNARIDIGADGEVGSGDEETPEAVARDFLANAGLVSPVSAGQAAGTDEEKSVSEDDASAGAPVQSTETLTTTESVTTTQVLPVAPTAHEPVMAVTRPATDSIVVGSADTSDEMLLGQMLLLLLEEAGLPATDLTGLGGPPTVRAALEQGSIDLAPAWSARALTAWHTVPASALPSDAGRSYALAQSLDQPLGLIWLNRGFFSGAPALLVPQALAGQGVRTISDLADRVNEEETPFKLCADEAFVDNSLTPLEAHYNFHIDAENRVITVAEAAYTGLRDGACDVAVGLATDGRVSAWHLFALEDDLAFFAGDTLAPVMRQAVLEEYPEVETPLGRLGETLNNASMSQLLALIDLGPDGEPASADEMAVREVAALFLCQQALITQCAALNQAALSLVPGSTPSAEAAPIPSSGGDADSAIVPAMRVLISTPTTNGVNARQAPNTQADILGLLPANTLVPAIGRTLDNAWLHIVLPDGALAWVFTNAVIARSEAIAQLPVIRQ